MAASKFLDNHDEVIPRLHMPNIDMVEGLNIPSYSIIVSKGLTSSRMRMFLNIEKIKELYPIY